MLKRCLGGLSLATFFSTTALAQGIIFPSTGARHRAMAGASTAAPIDAAGATYWNPAAMAAMEDGQVFVGVDFLYANTFLDSGVEATGAFGSNRSDSGLSGAPSFAVVTRPENSTFTYGVGVFGIVGRTIDFPGSDVNPILTPYDPPRSFGFGPVSSRNSGLTIAPMMSKQLNSLIAVGVGAQVTSLSVAVDPAFFAERLPSGIFPPATQGRSYWGGGFQAGVLFTPASMWNFGVSYKSRQAFETFDFNSKDGRGNARPLSLELSFPWILSFGAAYEGIEKTLVSFDFRHLAYAGTELFGETPAEGGLGWDSIWAMALGVERQVTEMITVQGGLSMNGNPIPDTATLLNIQLPAINKYAISGGASVALTERVDITGSVVYGFLHTNRGTILEIPGTLVEIRQDLYTFSLGLTFGL
jgi:long-chain fatty acid transport protein